jgi:hypothetical protein
MSPVTKEVYLARRRSSAVSGFDFPSIRGLQHETKESALPHGQGFWVVREFEFMGFTFKAFVDEFFHLAQSQFGVAFDPGIL